MFLEKYRRYIFLSYIFLALLCVLIPNNDAKLIIFTLLILQSLFVIVIYLKSNR